VLVRLNPFKKYIFLAPFEYTIGNAAEHIYYGLLAARLTNKKLVLIVRQPGFVRRISKGIVQARLTNREIFKVRSEGMIIPSDYFFCRVFGKILDLVFIPMYFFDKVMRRLFKKEFNSFFAIPTFGHNTVYNPGRELRFSWAAVEKYNWEKTLAENIPVSINTKSNLAAEEILVQMGLPKDSWYVTIHVRERGFYNESEAAGAYRCANIHNYIETIKYITSLGVWVVRLGDSSMTPLPDMDCVIDYPHTPFKSDLMDLYLIKNCSLYIGMDSGTWGVACLFQKSSLLTNSTAWCLTFPSKHGDLAIIKHFYSKSRGRFLSVRECLEEPPTMNYHFLDSAPDHDKSDYIIVENTSYEIKSAVEEKLDLGENYQYSELQNYFIEKRKKQIKQWLVEDPYLAGNTMQSFRFSTMYFYKGTLSQKFLEDNWEFGEYLEKLTERFKKNNLLHL